MVDGGGAGGTIIFFFGMESELLLLLILILLEDVLLVEFFPTPPLVFDNAAGFIFLFLFLSFLLPSLLFCIEFDGLLSIGVAADGFDLFIVSAVRGVGGR